ncbi:heterokaryon incompatibility protein-domain-containing protein [Xylaria venustula]|nr:heterokaryon incompatibility protein-domain-containing protein [Xylaria venustula]
MLCVRCHNFDIQAFARNAYPYRGYRLSSIGQSAREGCSFCSLLLHHAGIDASRASDSTFSFLSPEWVHFSVVREANSTSTSLEDDEGLNISFLHVEFDGEGRELDLHTAADECTPARESRDITGRVVGTHCFAERHISLAMSWLEDCDLNHPACHSTLFDTQTIDLENTALPSRCIEIRDLGPMNSEGASPSSRMTGVELWDWQLSETSGQTGKYIILSHRWNEAAEACKTMRSNYPPQFKGARHKSPDMGLSPLFVDVCRMAYRFHIRYVWIDSICIIQDDPEDWKRESAKMADYYQRAWLTICATMTAPHGGLISNLEVDDLPRVSRLPYRNKGGQREGYFYVQCCHTDLPEAYEFGVTLSELLNRGWVHQEWTLSRRILTFSKLGIFLECQSSDPQSISGDMVSMMRSEPGFGVVGRAGYDIGSKSRRELLLPSEPVGIEYILRDWDKTIQRFSVLGLTKLAQDRLVAIAGVAREFSRAIDSCRDRNKTLTTRNNNACTISRARKYVCGIFMQEILASLLWECAKAEEMTRVDGIPTWSWASIGGSEITYPYRRYRDAEVCEIFEAVTIPVDGSTWQPDFSRPMINTIPDDEFGNDNRFVVLGILAVVQPVQVDEVFPSLDDAYIAQQATCYYNKETNKTWRRVSTPSNPNVIAGWAALDAPSYQSTATRRSSVGGIHALHIGKINRYQDGWYQYAFEVLYLRPVERQGFADCFERIGVGRLFGPDSERFFDTTEKKPIYLV